MQPIAVPTDKAGELYIPALGKKFMQVELREDDIYDTVQIASGAITVGAEYIFFRDIQNKNEQHCNLTQSAKIASGDEVAVFRVGLYPRNKVGATHAPSTDILQVIEGAHFIVQVNRRVITSGPAVKYPSGYGLSGMSDLGAATAGNQALSVGVPSVAAAPTLFVPQQLKGDDDLNGKLRFPAATWVSGYDVPTLTGVDGLLVTAFLHGVIKSPLGK